MTPISLGVAAVLVLGGFWVAICSLPALEWWRSRRSQKAQRVPVQVLAPDVVEYDLLEVLGDVPALPDDEHLQWEARTMRRMQAIEAVGDRDGWECGICHAPAEHLYFVELHDDGTLCCAVCTQLLDAGALE